MPTSYTSLLGLALPVTGELAGTWGDTVNNYITSYVDASVAGTQTISGSQTAVTLSVTNGSSLVTAGSGATGSAQFQIINCTGNPAGLLTITAPASSRQYIIINATSTNQSVKIVGAGPTTGVTLVAGEKAHVAWNGSDFVKIATQSGNGSFVDLTVSGNLTLSGGTANGVLYLNGSKVATSGSALTFDGTSFKATGKIRANNAGVPTADVGFVTLNGYQGTSASDGGFAIAPTAGGGAEFYTHTGAVGAETYAERLRITSGGQVNIGGNFTSTNNTLQVTGNAAIGYTTAAPTTGLIVAGNVGIGTDSPAARVDARNGVAGEFVAINALNTLYDGATAASSTIRLGITNSAGVSYATIKAAETVNDDYPSLVFGVQNIVTTNPAERMKIDPSGTLILRQSSNAANTSVSFNTTVQNALTLDSSGNLGLGVTPSTGGYGIASQIAHAGNGGAITAQSISANNYPVNLTANAISSGVSTWKYFNTDASSASRYEQRAGVHSWHTAASGTAGNPITFTQAMTLDASGNLGIGSTTALGTEGRLGVYATGDQTSEQIAAAMIGSWDSGGMRIYFGVNNTNQYTYIGSVRSGIDYKALVLQPNGGNLGIGTTNPGAKLHVNGSFQVGSVSDYVRLTQTNTNVFGWLCSPLGDYSLYFDTLRGNLGLGVTPSAWNGYTAFEVKGGSALASSGVETELATNAFFNSGWKYLTAGPLKASRYESYNGYHAWFTDNTGGTIGNPISSFTQAMTLDASGNWLVGGTSTFTGTGNRGITASVIATTNNSVFTIESTGTTANANYAVLDFVNRSQSSGDSRYAEIYASRSSTSTTALDGFLAFATSNGGTVAERARITPGGQFAMTNDGTNAAPAISFTNDLDTGIFRPTTNQLGFATAGVQAMTLDASGTLLVGATSSDLSGSSKAIVVGNFAVQNGGSTGTYLLVVPGAANGTVDIKADARTGAYPPLTFYTGNTEVARITSAGELLVAQTAVGNGGTLAVNGTISIGTTTSGTQSSMSKDGTQLTSSISTSATTIFSNLTQGMSSASAAQFLIYGHNNAGAGFVDVVVAKSSGTPVVISSSTVQGSPAARTYTISTDALQLAMASGTYSVNVRCTTMGYPF